MYKKYDNSIQIYLYNEMRHNTLIAFNELYVFVAKNMSKKDKGTEIYQVQFQIFRNVIPHSKLIEESLISNLSQRLEMEFWAGDKIIQTSKIITYFSPYNIFPTTKQKLRK